VGPNTPVRVLAGGSLGSVACGAIADVVTVADACFDEPPAECGEPPAEADEPLLAVRVLGGGPFGPLAAWCGSAEVITVADTCVEAAPADTDEPVEEPPQAVAARLSASTKAKRAATVAR
jgi:hypothetical protein